MAKYSYHQKDTTQDPLVKWFIARGCRYEHIGKPVDGLLDVPTRQGWLTVPVEFKGPRGQLRDSQRRFLGRWKAPAYVLSTEVECFAMLMELGWSARMYADQGNLDG